jgi:hypothetical protein
VRTIEEIKAKCEIFPHSARSRKEHWVWQGAYNKNGNVPVALAPDYTKDPSGKKTSVQSVYRAIRHITTGAPIERAGWRVCNVEGCVSPDCTFWGDREAYGKKISKTGRLRGRLSYKLNAQRRWAGRRKIDDAGIARLRVDPRPSKELADEYGVHHTTIQKYRSGELIGPTAGIFTGLMR